MKSCVIIGKTNVGKTVFAFNFADYLGTKQFLVTFRHPDGQVETREFAPSDALNRLVSSEPHTTRCLQSIAVEMPVGKGVRRFEIVDTSGLIEGIHSEAAVRRSMAQTLSTVRDADIVLHMVDASQAGTAGAVEALGEVDFQVAQFAQMRGGYLILANKMDLPPAKAGLARIADEFPGHLVTPVSALHRQGFKEVKRFVWRWL